MSQVVFFSLGNPGPLNRHSAGHYVLKKLVDAISAKQITKKGKYSFTTMDNVLFVKSNAYMNESGAALKSYLEKERVGRCVVVVLYDDFEVSLPKVRLQVVKQNESHNGVKSLWKELQPAAITGYKLGIGIGPKPQSASKDTMASWVLSDFKPTEKEALETSMESVYKYVHHIIETNGNIGDCNKLNASISN